MKEKKIHNSNFELIENIIKDMKFNYEESVQDKKQQLFDSWEEIIGKKISKFSKLFEISSDNVITVQCADSFVANELYFEKDKIFTLVNKKAQELGIKLEGIKFDYKKWKE